MRAASFALLRLLADGAVRSTGSLARSLGLSQAAVRDAARELRGNGVEVSAVPGRGYRLAEPPDLLDGTAVSAALAERGAAARLELLDQCESTNAALLARAAEDAPSGTALASELQTAGRGRRGAVWRSELVCSLTFSLLWRYASVRADLAGLSLAAGVACVRALDGLGVPGVRLKWPNDLVHGAGKLGGILVEATAEPRGPCVLVVGVGLNVRRSRALAKALAQPVTDLAALVARVPSRNALLAGLLGELAAALELFGAEGFAAFRDDWHRLHAQQDARVRVLLPDGAAAEGVALGVAEDGALLLGTESGVKRYHSGEVSLRRAA